MDWQLLALPPDYFKAASHTQPVGTLTGDFVKFLLTFGVELRNLHLIGFSLGAHVVGRAGHMNNGTIPRITGIGPRDFTYIFLFCNIYYSFFSIF